MDALDLRTSAQHKFMKSGGTFEVELVGALTTLGLDLYQRKADRPGAHDFHPELRGRLRRRDVVPTCLS